MVVVFERPALLVAQPSIAQHPESIIPVPFLGHGRFLKQLASLTRHDCHGKQNGSSENQIVALGGTSLEVNHESSSVL